MQTFGQFEAKLCTEKNANFFSSFPVPNLHTGSGFCGFCDLFQKCMGQGSQENVK